MERKNMTGKTKKYVFPLIVMSSVMVSESAHAELNISGEISVQQRIFLEETAYPGQTNSQASVSFAPQLQTWLGDSSEFTFMPFARIDQRDSERTHADIREALFSFYFDAIEVRAGIGKVFWGQTESVHLVDIINQTDFVESIDAEDKLGQPLLDFRYLMDSGYFSVYVLPYFRERTFPGMDGRLRGPLFVDVDNPVYQSEDEQNHVDYALRWQQTFGSLEFGLSYFEGTDRLPEFIPASDQEGAMLLQPFYGQLRQVGLDMLYVAGGWLLKLEALQGERMNQSFSAAVGGVEYTIADMFGSGKDLGLLMEYQYDERDSNPYIFGQNDLMLGLRWSLNDFAGSEVLFAFVQDLDESSSYSIALEASTRLTSHWRVSLNGYIFESDVLTDGLFFINQDDHLSLEFSYFF